MEAVLILLLCAVLILNAPSPRLPPRDLEEG